MPVVIQEFTAKMTANYSGARHCLGKNPQRGPGECDHIDCQCKCSRRQFR
jgi:hypothetical protein